MKVIHVTWNVKKSFNNSGNLYLWIEHHKPIKKDKFYLYQLDNKGLDKFIEKYLNGITFIPAALELNLIANKKGAHIPSPIISNLIDFEDTNVSSFNKTKVHALKAISTLSFLKTLNFISYYIDEDIVLGDDAKFWIKMGVELSRLIKHDQYIPSIVARKNKARITYLCKWESLSNDYNSRLEKIAQYMPLSSSSIIHCDNLSILKNFSEVVLTEFMQQTSFPQKQLKMVEGSVIENAIHIDDFNLDESIWKKWKQWRNNLEYEQLGAPFKLVLRLNAPEEANHLWNIELSMQSKEDASFMLDISLYYKNKEKNKAFYQKMLGTSIDHFLLLQIGYACRLYPPIEKIFNNKFTSSLVEITQEDAYRFLKEDAWTLNACGYRIIVPSWWSHKGRSKAKIQLKASQKKIDKLKLEAPKTYFGYESLVGFDYSYSIGDQTVSANEWNELLKAKTDLVFFKGQWIEINPEEMQKMQSLIESSEKDKKEGNIKDLINMTANDSHFNVEMDNSLEDMMEKLANKEKLAPLDSPKDLSATLRPYQTRGLSWLSYLESIGMNPCLADDMGLGKTMQIIALLLSKPSDTPALLVAPTSVIGNWDREIKKFAPSIEVFIYHGNQRKDISFHKAIEKKQIIITSFGLLRRDKAVFQGYHWSRIIVDEAQNIKNPTSSQTKALCSLKSDSKIALTGTPIENRLMDLWSIFHFLNPNYLGAKSYFRKNFELPIQKDNNEIQTKILKKMVEPFILRRVKTDKNIIKDLPEKIEQKVYCQLTKEQATIYQAIVNETTEKLQSASSKEKNAIFVTSLLRLKQACNHPAQALQDGSEFCASRSIKLERLVNMAKEIMANGESLLIFSQFKEICDALNKLLKTKLGFNTFYIHGGTSRTNREKMIEEFQNPDFPASIFVLSLKAGGVGITLTKANHVIHFDRWWNPAVENQATDRAYRIGQKKTVFAHKYITLGTIEEKIDLMLSDKQKMSDMIVGSDESWLGKLDTSSFLELIKLQSDMVVQNEAA
jgi:SNF2 family DNA or RNA helicase